MANKVKMPGRCPNCGSNNIQAEPLYPYEDLMEEDYADDDEGDIAVFCVSCGHYMGEQKSQLGEKLADLRQQIMREWLR